MSGPLPAPDHNRVFYWESRIKTALKYLDYTEIYSYSLVAKDQGLKLKNPLTTDWVYLRTSLFPSHRQIITENRGRVNNMNLFEIANVYLPRTDNLPEEQPRLILTTTNSDYYRFKGTIEVLLSDLGIRNIPIDIKSDSDLFYWEIALTNLLSQATDSISYTPISKFSPIIEDVNININTSYAKLEKKIFSLSPLIKQIEVIDKYNDKLTIRLTYHSDQKQLSNDDITPIREKISKINS
jgi:phenylalanyl-tRNA synthetase beta subunit